MQLAINYAYQYPPYDGSRQNDIPQREDIPSTEEVIKYVVQKIKEDQ